MINVNHQNDQACVLKVANNAIVTDAIPPQTGEASGEGFASVPGAFECRDCSECGTDTSGGLWISFPKPLRDVG